MRESVDRGVGDDAARRGEQVFAVQQGELREDLVRDRALGAKVVTGQDGDGGHLGTGAAGRGNADDRQGVRDRILVVEVVGAVVFAADHQGDGLGGIHGGPASDADDIIHPLCDAQVAALHDGLDGRVFLHFGEDDTFHAVFREGVLDIPDGPVVKGAAAACDDEGLFSEGGQLRGMDPDTVFITVYFCRHLKIPENIPFAEAD